MTPTDGDKIAAALMAVKVAGHWEHSPNAGQEDVRIETLVTYYTKALVAMRREGAKPQAD